MHRFASAAFAFALALAGSGLASAADSMSPPAGGGHMNGFRQACGADLQTYCYAAQSREERHACVEANKDKFSDGCKSFMAQHTHGQGQAPAAPTTP